MLRTGSLAATTLSYSDQKGATVICRGVPQVGRECGAAAAKLSALTKRCRECQRVYLLYRARVNDRKARSKAA